MIVSLSLPVRARISSYFKHAVSHRLQSCRRNVIPFAVDRDKLMNKPLPLWVSFLLSHLSSNTEVETANCASTPPYTKRRTVLPLSPKRNGELCSPCYQYRTERRTVLSLLSLIQNRERRTVLSLLLIQNRERRLNCASSSTNT